MDIPLPILGSYFDSIETQWNITTNPQRVVKPDPSRWALIISNSNNAPVYFGNPTVSVPSGGTFSPSTAGIILPGGDGPRLFYFTQVGSWVQTEKWMVASVGGGSFAITEIYYRPVRIIEGSE